MLQLLSCLRTLLLMIAFVLARPVFAEKAMGPRSFATPEEAAKALVDAARSADASSLRTLFGSTGSDIVDSGDSVQDTNDRQTFVELADQRLRIDRVGDGKAVLDLGDDAWPFPIPLVQRADGWVFDAQQGREEMLDRRIGRNELGVLRVMDAYLQAQAEYASADRDGDHVPEYAQKLRSEPGQRDGLFWEKEAEGTESPLGPLVADARAEGYRHGESSEPAPYHGYYFRILTGQGKQAPGGAHSYVINGNMIAGFGLLAFPAEYGSSGVMSFVLNQSGEIYQKDLGPNTSEIAGKITAYNPDVGWILVDRGP